jgi:PTS system beta-glucosides-specific IIC component
MSGEVILIEKVPDEVFSQKMLGNGVAIIPNIGEVYAPFDSEIIQVFDTFHAYGLVDKDGIELLIHIGVDTVELKGKGFESFVKVGKKVKTGDIIAKFDLNFLNKTNYSICSPVIITNSNNFNFNFKYGQIFHGETLATVLC